LCIAIALLWIFPATRVIGCIALGLIALLFVVRYYVRRKKVAPKPYPQTGNSKSVFIKLTIFATVGFMLFGIGKFALSTEAVLITDAPVQILEATRHDTYASIKVAPNEDTEPNIFYRVLLDNGLIKVSYDVSWDVLEIDIGKVKELSHHLSQDELTALASYPSYSVAYYQVAHTYPISWALFPALVLFLVCLFFIPGWLKEKTARGDVYDKIREDLKKALLSIDRTCKQYNDENEANRELTGILVSLGYTAYYNWYLRDLGRSVDIFLPRFRVIIEGKLDPQQTDIDRLVGQVSFFKQCSYRVFIVVFGFLDYRLVARIYDEVIYPSNNAVFLIKLRGEPIRRRRDRWG